VGLLNFPLKFTVRIYNYSASVVVGQVESIFKVEENFFVFKTHKSPGLGSFLLPVFRLLSILTAMAEEVCPHKQCFLFRETRCNRQNRKHWFEFLKISQPLKIRNSAMGREIESRKGKG
jgi:hypothetical protein